MTSLAEFLGPEAGQRRRRWVNRIAGGLADNLRYYGGPGLAPWVDAAPEIAQYSDAGDVMAVGDTGRGLMNSPSVAAVGDFASAVGAAAMPFVGYKLMTDGVNAATDIARGARDSGRVGSNLGNIADDATDPARQRADEVLSLLSSGRGAEVT